MGGEKDWIVWNMKVRKCAVNVIHRAQNQWMGIDPGGTGETAATNGQEAEANLLQSWETWRRSRKVVMEGKIEGIRPWGRQRTMWYTNNKKLGRDRSKGACGSSDGSKDFHHGVIRVLQSLRNVTTATSPFQLIEQFYWKILPGDPTKTCSICHVYRAFIGVTYKLSQITSKENFSSGNSNNNSSNSILKEEESRHLGLELIYKHQHVAKECKAM